MASSSLQAKAQALNAKMESEATVVINDLETKYLRPIARNSYACVLKCYDQAGSTGTSEEIQNCSQKCQISFQRAQHALQEVYIYIYSFE